MKKIMGNHQGAHTHSAPEIDLLELSLL
jgi:hypothetical protein